TAAQRRFQTLQRLVKEISLADPSGKCLENLDSSDPAARAEAAAIIEPLLNRAEAAAGTADAPAPASKAADTSEPRGLDRVRAAFSRQSRAVSPLKRPKAPGPSAAKHLTGLDRTIAALREQSGHQPLPHHLAVNHEPNRK
ncbi:MAG: hypothetical protein KF791_20410, partial [Verrucomicrobiae bacterium]|nr:hypothetical protein [Verrucomicrobiae bacterium]